MSSNADTSSLVVFKIGGSLLDLPNLAEVVRSVIAQRAGSGVALVIGGGATADVVRDWDRTFGLSSEDAHWLAIEAMSLNESLLERLLPEIRIARSPKQVASAVAERRPALICADCFLRWGEAAGCPPLPRSWDVTSDSIAAWAAQALSADELILMKSTALPAGLTLEEAARVGLVDPCFHQFASLIPRLSWLDARSQDPQIKSWQRTS